MIDGDQKKINVLWVSYQIILPIAESIGVDEPSPSGGWLQGAYDYVRRYGEIKLSYCFPYSRELEGEVQGVRYYSLPFVDNPSKDVSDSRNRFRQILAIAKPDLIHIFGTEMFFLRWTAKRSLEEGMRDRTVVWIQGLKGVCSKRNSDGLDIKEAHYKTFYEHFAGMSLDKIRRSLQEEGKDEIKVIKSLKQVFVRTDWDRAICLAYNPEVKLYNCFNTLRPIFYECKEWDIKEIERHSLFVSQYYAALKGLHKVVEALGILKKKYPDVRLYVIGKDLFKEPDDLIGRIKISGYEKVLKNKIEKNNVKDNIVFLKRHSAEQMCERFRKSHVYILASSIENESNSLCEAMMVGTPTVSSYVGGVCSVFEHGKDGYFYPYNETEMLAYYVSKIFDNDELAISFSKAARKHAMSTHDRDKNYHDLIQAYKEIRYTV